MVGGVQCRVVIGGVKHGVGSQVLRVCINEQIACVLEIPASQHARSKQTHKNTHAHTDARKYMNAYPITHVPSHAHTLIHARSFYIPIHTKALTYAYTR